MLIEVERGVIGDVRIREKRNAQTDGVLLAMGLTALYWYMGIGFVALASPVSLENLDPILAMRLGTFTRSLNPKSP